MIEVEIEDNAWLAVLPDAAAIALTAAETSLTSRIQGAEDVTVLLTDDDTVRELNARFRGKDVATNVLSFPAVVQAGGHLGDIALAYGVCAREAAEQGKILSHHLSHLVAHGVLHLLGFDHVDEDEAEAMEALERRLLQELGVADPYQAGDQSKIGPEGRAPNV